MPIVVDELPRRRRRTPAALRREALDAARRLLEQDGPAAVTLQAVAAQIGMAHGSITHHFGTASNLQAAVAEDIVGMLLATVECAVRELRAGIVDERHVVDLVFDTFEQTGTGALLGWLAAQRSPHLGTLYAMFGALPDALAQAGGDAVSPTAGEIARMAVAVVVPALGTALIGAGLTKSLGMPADVVREATAVELARLRTGAPTD